MRLVKWCASDKSKSEDVFKHVFEITPVKPIVFKDVEIELGQMKGSESYKEKWNCRNYNLIFEQRE